MARKERYHVTLDPALVASAERLGESKSDAIEQGLKLLIRGHTGRTQPTDKQTMASQRELVEFKKELKENKQTTEFLTKNAKMLTEKIEQIPQIFAEIKEIRPKLKQDLTLWVSDMNVSYGRVKGLDDRLKVVEGKLEHALYQAGHAPAAEISYAIQPLENRIERSEERLQTLEKRDAKGKADTLSGDGLPRQFFRQ